MTEDLILRVVTKVLTPFIMLFAFYTQFHGDYGPGGGFQAGVILAAAFVLNALTFGLPQVRKALPDRIMIIGTGLGVLLYAGTGMVSLFRGGNLLEYGVLDHHSPVHGQHLGILLVELGVGITVTSVMWVIISTFMERAVEDAEGGEG